VFVCDNCSSSDKTAEITAVPISSGASAATTGYGCKNSILPLVSSFCAQRGLCVAVRFAFYMKHPVFARCLSYTPASPLSTITVCLSLLCIKFSEVAFD
jgi:hypothetical protein